MWEFRMPPVKTGASPQPVNIPKSATHLCIAVNGMTTRGLGNRVKFYRRIQCTLSFFGCTLSNAACLQREFSKTHVGFQFDYWSLRDTLNLRFYRPDMPNSFSTSTLSGITVRHHVDEDNGDGADDGDAAKAPVTSTSARRCRSVVRAPAQAS